MRSDKLYIGISECMKVVGSNVEFYEVGKVRISGECS